MPEPGRGRRHGDTWAAGVGAASGAAGAGEARRQ